jgi:hypothetical protein
MAVLVATPANVVAQLAAAKPGDTVQLVGAFDHVALKNRVFSPPLTLDLTQATLVNLHLDAAQGVTIQGGVFKAKPGDWLGALYVGGHCAHVKISGVTIDASGGPGVTFRDSMDCSLESSRIDNTRVGVTVMNVDGFSVVGNTLVGMSADGVDVYSCWLGRVTHNVICGSHATDDAHRDGIQLGDTIAGAAPSSDIEVAYNLIHGDTQGVTSFRPNPGHLRISIHDNMVVGSQPQGIALYDGQNSTVKNNHVHTLPGALNRTSVNVVGGNTAACGNTASAGAGKAAWADGACP